MAAGEEGRLNEASEDADFAKAFQALAQGEQTATQLENHLTALESRIDDLLKQANENQQLAEAAKLQSESSKPGEDTRSTGTADGNAPSKQS